MKNLQAISQEIQHLKREEKISVAGNADWYSKSFGFEAKAEGGIAWGLLFCITVIIILILTGGQVNLMARAK